MPYALLRKSGNSKTYDATHIKPPNTQTKTSTILSPRHLLTWEELKPRVNEILQTYKLVEALNMAKESDQWETPAYVWKNLLNHLPRRLTLWDPFVHENGRSAVYMEDLGFKVVRTDPYPKDDALKINVDDYHNCSVDIIVTNPPFSKFRECLKWLEDSV